MAFTFCTNCGNKIEDGVIKCPYCGHIKGSERNYTYGSYGENPNELKNQAPQNNGAQGEQNNSGQEQGPYNGQQNQYGGYSQSPYGQNQNPYGQNQNPYGQNPYNRDPYGNQQNQSPYNQQNPYGMPPPGGFYRPVVDRPMSFGLLIFSIINIIFGCCCSVGFVFGIIALVYTINARQAPTDDEEIRRKKIALFMNITAVVLTLAFIVAFAFAFVGGMFSA